MALAPVTADLLMRRRGEEIGVSGWIALSQQRIDLFAEATLDAQFIHVDPERAAATRFGGTIAHGFLVLSLLSHMASEAMPPLVDQEMAVNYGINRLRFVAPVKAGERLRGRFVLRDVARKAPGQLLLTCEVTVEIEGGERPALVAEWLTLTVLRPAAG